MPHFATHDGVNLAFNAQGSGSDCVLCIQGVGCAGSAWRPQTTDLAKDMYAVSFDNRGIGGSTPWPAALTVEDMAKDTLAVMEAANLGPCHLVGHSLGGVIAQRVALMAPHKVRTLSLMCTVARGADATDLTWRMLWLGVGTRLGTRDMRRRAFARMIFPREEAARWSNPQGFGQLAELFGRDLADSPPIILRQLKALSRHSTQSELASLSVPVLILSGVHDPIARPDAVARLAQGIRGARHVTFDDASHALPIQKPNEVNSLLREFFAQHATAGS